MYPFIHWNFSLYNGIRLLCKGDGRSYNFIIQPNSFIEDTYYEVNFTTVYNEWKYYEFFWDDFIPNSEGERFLRTRNSNRPMNDIIAIAISIDDKRIGQFELELKSIELFNK